MSVTRSDDEGSRWGWLNSTLAFLAVALLVGAGVLFVKGPDVNPDARKAEVMSEQYTAITKAARETTTAFMDVDYTDMEPRIERVLAGATGSFQDQYSRASVELKAQLAQEQTVASGKILEVGIGDLSKDKAVVFVAADLKVRNKSTKGKEEPRYYRFQLDMVKEKGKWKVAEFGYLDGRQLSGDQSSGVGSGDQNSQLSPSASPSGGASNGQ